MSSISLTNGPQLRIEILKKLIILYLMGPAEQGPAAITAINQVFQEKGYTVDEIDTAINLLIAEGKIQQS